jgi:N-acetylglucosamine malate deacetylase 1
MAAITRITFELSRGSDVHCAYLTDGAFHVSSSIRNAESLTVLTSLGVPAEQVYFIGSTIPIRDGALVYRMDQALAHLTTALSKVAVSSVYALAWEGGHPDHDASHIVAVAFAKTRGLINHCHELMLYRGTAGGRLFRMFSPRNRREWLSRRVSIREGLRAALMARHYRSQRKSWLGLFAETFFKLAILRRELIRPVDLQRLRSRPHRDSLLYERRFGVSYVQFESAASAFIRTHFG